MSSETESFPHYEPDTDETGDGFYVFVVLYTTLSFLIIAPLVIWGRKYQRERDAALSRVAFYSHQNEFAATEHTFSPQPQEEHPHHQHLHPSQVQSGSPFRDPRVQQPIHAPLGARAVAVRSIFRGIDRVSLTVFVPWSSRTSYSEQRLNRSFYFQRSRQLPTLTKILITYLFYQDRKIDLRMQLRLQIKLRFNLPLRPCPPMFRVRQLRLDSTLVPRRPQRLKCGMYELEGGSHDDPLVAQKWCARLSRRKRKAWVVHRIDRNESPCVEVALTPPTLSPMA